MQARRQSAASPAPRSTHRTPGAVGPGYREAGSQLGPPIRQAGVAAPIPDALGSACWWCAATASGSCASTSRALAVGGVVMLAGAGSFVGALLHDWLQLRHLTRESRTFAAQIAEQRKTIEDFNRRVAALRKEVGAWHELHARIQEPFGPDAGRSS